MSTFPPTRGFGVGRMKTAGMLVAGGWLLVAGWVQAQPAAASAPATTLRSLLRAVSALPGLGWVDYAVAEFSANILLFVPMGLLFTLLLGAWRWWLAVTIGVAATLGIEFVQLFLPARFTDVRDLLANTLGTLIGVGVALLVAARRRRG